MGITSNALEAGKLVHGPLQALEDMENTQVEQWQLRQNSMLTKLQSAAAPCSKSCLYSWYFESAALLRLQ
jgi:hypothetical protein